MKAKVDKVLEIAFDQQDVVVDTKKQMGDCEIPTNINMRGNEVDQLAERLDNLQKDFAEMKQADEDFEGTAESEKEIKALITEIDKRLKGFEQERKDHAKGHKKLEQYTEKDIYSINNAHIVVEVRDLKAAIKDTMDRLKDLEGLLDDLNNKLILQDMANALKLLDKKTNNLKERLE